MTESDHRQDGRDSLFLLADLRLAGETAEHRVKVRNLSAGGMMADGAVRVARGAPVQVNLRNLGWVDGVVAWVQDSRFGVAFLAEIDPRAARSPLVAGESTPRFVKPVLSSRGQGTLRKI